MKLQNETIKIQRLNDTTLCVRPVLPDGKTIVPIDDEGQGLTTDISVVWGINGHETAPVEGISFKDGYICIPILYTMPLGAYDVHITGKMVDGREVSDNRRAMFELVEYGNGISYENYYTDMVIVGLPDQYAEDLRRELAEKIVEAEKARNAAVEKSEEYAEALMNLDDIARKSDLGKMTVMTDDEYEPALADLNSKLV